jgi:hypothetical protein
MESTAFDLVDLMNLVLNDLTHNMFLLKRFRDLEEQGSLSNDDMNELYTSLINLSILKASKLETLIAKNRFLRPTGEGVEIIEFWLKARECIIADKADDN